MAAGLHAQYFPKHHHPACDRTGQNDCDCPDKTSGELFLESVNKALQASLEDTKEYKEEYKQRYELLTTLSGIAYDNLLLRTCGSHPTPNGGSSASSLEPA